MNLESVLPEGVLVMDDRHLQWLRQLATALCSGSDAMRDQGNALWLVIWEIEGINRAMADIRNHEEK
jgi:hypothetical protein